MQIAFLLFKYHPFGGASRDTFRFAHLAAEKGCEVRVFCLEGAAEAQADHAAESGFCIEPIKLPCRVWPRYRRYRQAGAWVRAHLSKDTILWGSNKTPYLDVYYAADGCLQSKYGTNWRNTWDPRRRLLLQNEADVCGTQGARLVFTLSEYQNREYLAHYPSLAPRLRVLPPGIREDCIYISDKTPFQSQIRRQYGIPDSAYVLLMVGSGFKTKGLDRAIQLLAHLHARGPQSVHLLVVGQDKYERFMQQAHALGVADYLHFAGGQADLQPYYGAADTLLHLAHWENAGMVIVEALITGLPVWVTQSCGYSHFVAAHAHSGAGRVWAEPWDGAACADSLAAFLSTPQQREYWWRNGAREFAANPSLRQLHEIGLQHVYKQFTTAVA